MAEEIRIPVRKQDLEAKAEAENTKDALQSESPVAEPAAEPVAEEKEELTPEEGETIQRVFFEDDEKIRLRDGITYSIPPLSLRDGVRLMNTLNTIDTTVIVFNLMRDPETDEMTKFEALMDALLMAFKPYYPEMTKEYLETYVDIDTAKKILDIMIGLNTIKKSL